MMTSTQLIVTGAICLIFGIAALLFPSTSSMFVDSLVGWVFLAAGISGLFAAFKVSKLVSGMGIAGLMLLVIGVFLLANPTEGLIALTVIMAGFFVIGGIARLVWARTWKDSPSYWVVLISGAVSILLGVMILANIVSSAETLLGVFLGIELLMAAVPLILMGLRQR